MAERTGSGCGQGTYEDLGDSLQSLPVGFVESCGPRAVEIEDTDEFVSVDQRHHDLGTGVGVTGDMPWKRVHLRDDLGPAGGGRGPADTFAESDTNARRFSLEGTDDELVAVEEVEADPVHIRQGVKHQGCQIGGIGDPVGFADDQRGGLVGELPVLSGVVSGEWFDTERHGGIVERRAVTPIHPPVSVVFGKACRLGFSAIDFSVIATLGRCARRHNDGVMTSQHISTTRRAAIIGAGQAGATAALGLLDAGFDVTVYSNLDRDALRNDVPATGTALVFGEAQDAEEALGLPTYRDRAPLHSGLTVRIAGGGDELIAFDGEFDGYVGLAVDTRLKAGERLDAFVERGGVFVVDDVTVEKLDAIAAANDLTLVATGRGGLSELFPIDTTRTVYDAPQRSLLTVTVTGLGHDASVFAHRSPAGGGRSGFSILAEQGEAWWGPYLHKDAGPSWAFLGWARPGSEWEKRFAAADSARSAHRIVQDLYRDYLDWDLPEVLATRVIESDPHSWLKGAVRPVVRAGVGTTPGGHTVASLGDTSVAYDPIAGQGAQSGLIQAQRLVEAAKAHEGPFDAAWITLQYESFLAGRSDAASKVTRLFLSDPEFGEIGNRFFAAAAVDPRFAGALVGLLHRPQPFSGVNSTEDAQAYITEITGEDAGALLEKFRPAGRFDRSTYTAPVATVS